MITERECSACKEPKAPDEFPPKRAGSLAGPIFCLDCQEASRQIRRNREAKAKGEQVIPGHRNCADAITVRNCITAPNLLDTFDRGERREELSELGGLCGVRDIRRRIAAARRAKEILCGSTLPLEVIDRLLEVAS